MRDKACDLCVTLSRVHIWISGWSETHGCKKGQRWTKKRMNFSCWNQTVNIGIITAYFAYFETGTLRQ